MAEGSVILGTPAEERLGCCATRESTLIRPLSVCAAKENGGREVVCVGEDEFLGWRCACIAGGRGCYADALAGRSAPPVETRFEELMFAPMRAWTRSHGTKPEAYPHQPVPSCQTFGNRDGWT